ncbi:MAG: very short patch repair endonuclease, partial [Planctomycetes bacterium]|nr:very short patch repair endonuclease [Planctomycetota bacterium]
MRRPRLSVPATNAKFYGKRIETNRERDTRTERSLLELGLRVLTLWEYALRDQERLRRKLVPFLVL